jgi:HEAT repeat protein
VDNKFLREELSKVGVLVNDIWDLVNTRLPYPSAVPVLLDFLKKGIDDSHMKEGVVRALAVKEAIGKASEILISEYNRISKDEIFVRWAIGNTIYTTITKDDIDSILAIVQDKTNGMSRQMFVAALGKVKSEKAENVLINSLDDDDVVPHALGALGRMKSKKAKDKISALTNHSRTLVRKEALKALKKIS